MSAYAQAGRSLSHTADSQHDEAQPISEGDLQPGDLVFYGDPPSHDAIYVGGGQIINAPLTRAKWSGSRTCTTRPSAMTFGRIN